ncbi:hypothetical protein [Thalassotalea eurytherma]|uniref:Uncharacterized protein n=1 Tax=Thalassotalea eurytherma TaxID=1144278 RepID=A0ABQ6H2Z9_9GAMM|nr:hypothetical protein [Thalassotalea eurytherma]GLX82482.1 hypothetical protein theurythT_19340 [Thalassotalea eurytherma]
MRSLIHRIAELEQVADLQRPLTENELKAFEAWLPDELKDTEIIDYYVTYCRQAVKDVSLGYKKGELCQTKA